MGWPAVELRKTLSAVDQSRKPFDYWTQFAVLQPLPNCVLCGCAAVSMEDLVVSFYDFEFHLSMRRALMVYCNLSEDSFICVYSQILDLVGNTTA